MARASVTDPREYRRGMILGLTFAEVMLLLVFLLLLAAAAQVERMRRELAPPSPVAERPGPAGRAGAAAEPSPREPAPERRKQDAPSLLQPPATAGSPALEPPAELAARLERAEGERRRLELALGRALREQEALRRQQAQAQSLRAELAIALARLEGSQAEAQALRAGERAARERASELEARLMRAEAEQRRLEAALGEARRSESVPRGDQGQAPRLRDELQAALERLKGAAAEADALRALERSARLRAGELEAELLVLRAETSRNAARLVEQFEKVVQRGRELEARNRELEERLRALESERPPVEARPAERGKPLDRELALRMIAGGVYPSCLEENGRPVFLFDIVLLTGGRVVVQDAAPARLRSGEPWGAVERFPRGEPIDVSSFVRATRPLSEWSMRQDPPCRFWIKVRRELPLSAPTSEYLRVIGPLGSAANDHLPFYRVGG